MTDLFLFWIGLLIGFMAAVFLLLAFLGKRCHDCYYQREINGLGGIDGEKEDQDAKF